MFPIHRGKSHASSFSEMWCVGMFVGRLVSLSPLMLPGSDILLPVLLPVMPTYCDGKDESELAGDNCAGNCD